MDDFDIQTKIMLKGCKVNVYVVGWLGFEPQHNPGLT